MLLGFTWWWTSVLTIPEYTAKIKVIPKKGLPGADALRVLRCTYTGKEIRTFRDYWSKRGFSLI